ncbi:MAG: MarR family transcriptional regulator [Kiritimatiellae bacterium]|nr:MarR family transcriptional regulator [Kiritimatiellia bacterium]
MAGTLSMDEFADRLLLLTPPFMRRLMQHEQSDVMHGVLTEPQFWGLEFLREHGPCPVHQLADALHLQLSSTSGLVDRLAKMGMVRREHGKKDRRVVFISLTVEGKKTVKEVLEQKKRGYRGFCKPLSPRERYELIAMIRKIVE